MEMFNVIYPQGPVTKITIPIKLNLSFQHNPQSNNSNKFFYIN